MVVGWEAAEAAVTAAMAATAVLATAAAQRGRAPAENSR